MSVAPPKPVTAHLTWGVPTLCSYCYALPVKDGYYSTCAECVFKCENCGQMTPFENGVSWDEYCDPCGVALDSTPF